MDKYKFGEYVYQKRKELGLTQEELGRKLKLTNKAVSKWETGETLPDITLLPDLALILGITVDELLTQTKPEIHYEKPKKTPIILLSLLSFVLFLGLCVYIIYTTTPKKTLVTEENYKEYYNISLAGSTLKDTTLNLNITITDMDVKDAYLELNCTVVYYYTRSGVEGEITYTDRYITYDGSLNEFALELKPSVTLSDLTFVGYDITYSVVSVKGEIIQ